MDTLCDQVAAMLLTPSFDVKHRGGDSMILAESAFLKRERCLCDWEATAVKSEGAADSGGVAEVRNRRTAW